MRKYILSGGPCTGKTTILNELEKLGYTCIPESARILLEQESQKENGILPHDNLEKFQDLVIAHQEKALYDALQKKAVKGDIIFLDRSLIDNIGYLKRQKIDPSLRLLERINDSKYSKVFFLEQLPYKQDSNRYETEDEARRTHEDLRQGYQEIGLEMINIPPISIEERLQLILNSL